MAETWKRDVTLTHLGVALDRSKKLPTVEKLLQKSSSKPPTLAAIKSTLRQSQINTEKQV
jgi:hypothetical protein